MLSEEIRHRLSQLHRPPTPAASPDYSSPSFSLPNSQLPGESGPKAHSPYVQRSLFAPTGRSAAEQDLFGEAEETENIAGKHLRFRRPLAEVCLAADLAAINAMGHGILQQGNKAESELAAVTEHFPRGTLFLDLETCGFAGSAVFLAGLVWHAEGMLVLDQYFARNYAEERAVLESLWQIASEQRVLVTFNGKSFDWPTVKDRTTRHRLDRDLKIFDPVPRRRRGTAKKPAAGRRAANDQVETPTPSRSTHFDLLHHARRRWKRLLPDCRLQTLERYVCRRARVDDLPGALVPAAYHDYVRTGHTRQMEAVLQHNALDLATLVEVTLKLLASHHAAA